MRGCDPDPRDDVHALGVIWYQILTGDLARGRPSGQGWRNRLVAQGMTPDQLNLLESCFEDHPDDRPADAAELAEKLGKHLVLDWHRRQVVQAAATSSPAETMKRLIPQKKPPPSSRPDPHSTDGCCTAPSSLPWPYCSRYLTED